MTLPSGSHASSSSSKRAAVFVDGQNLFFSVRACFGYSFPNYDIRRLAQAACDRRQWLVGQIGFYTGMPSARENDVWHHFWTKKLLAIRRQGVNVYSRPLRYRERSVALPDGNVISRMVGEEKGIDVRLAIDIIRKAHRQEYDVAVVFSQDQDLSEVADELRAISREQGRAILMASAFPCRADGTGNLRGINRTDWIRIGQAEYDSCIDPYDYRDKRRLEVG